MLSSDNPCRDAAMTSGCRCPGGCLAGFLTADFDDALFKRSLCDSAPFHEVTKNYARIKSIRIKGAYVSIALRVQRYVLPSSSG